MKGRNRGKGPRHPRFSPGRRRFLAGAAGAAGTLILPGCSGDLGSAGNPGIEPDPDAGTLPGADGQQAGLSYYRGADPFDTWDLGAAGEFQGCAYKDPDHSHEGAIKQL